MPFLRRITRFLPRLFRRAPGAADLAALEKLIGHRFKKPLLLQTALTHPSHKTDGNAGDGAGNAAGGGKGGGGRTGNGAGGASGVGNDYQRLEFLGDAVLGLVLAEALYADATADEGLLTEARTRLACGRNLANVGRRLGLGKVLRVARNGDTARIRDSDTANEDATEALFGAVFLDGGLKAARKLALRLFGGELRMDSAQVEQGRSAKNKLQELVQGDGRPNSGKRIEYRSVEMRGPSHARHFVLEVVVDGVCRGRGEGPTKRAASEVAAQAALAALSGK